MISFADEALIEVRSGKGGNGCIAFRREKYVPNGGPNGGDGGRGGDVYFCVKRNLRTLSHLRHKQCFKAKNGCDGEGSNRYGRDGEDVYVPVPPGTTIRDAETGELICEFTTESENEVYKFLTGGKGGWGNMHFKSSTNQAPKYAHEGKPGETRFLKVELSIMADCGLVGFPNAGKSSLLDYFTNARPKIAPYPFTTKIPNLGVLHAGDANGKGNQYDIIIADIPGIIEGASEGAGLGTRFLKHISRTSCLIFVIDVSDDNYLTAFDTLMDELKSFSEELSKKKRIILCNKIDVEGAEQRAEELKSQLLKNNPDETVLFMSVYERTGLGNVQKAIISLVEENFNEKTERFASISGETALNREGKTKKSEFMKSRASCSAETTQYPGSEQGSGF
ncbi:MAG: GTPase ObgE [Treponemataceae bacterium]|nr:GTPase ObgE [Treponemataceae bacterium]